MGTEIRLEESYKTLDQSNHLQQTDLGENLRVEFEDNCQISTIKHCSQNFAKPRNMIWIKK